MEFKIITATDIHISDHGPRSRVDDYKKSLLEKIAQMRMACNKLSVDAAVIAGDLFDLKNPTRNSHGLVQDLIQMFRGFDCPVYMIEGNHDLRDNRLETINEQPLGVLFKSGSLIRLREEVLEKEKKKVSLVGIPFEEDLKLSNLKIPSKKGCVAQVCAMHIYSGPKPGDIFSERIYGYNELLNLGPDVFVLGHYHLDQGITVEDKVHFINVGSISRGSLSYENTKHEPKIALITIQGDGSITTSAIRLKVKASSEVFDLEKRDEEKEESKEIEAFVEKLSTESVETNKEKDFSSNIEKMDLTKEVREKTLSFIQEATNKIKSF